MAELLLGTGLTTIKFAAGPSFEIDLIGWVKWYITNGEEWAPEKGPKEEWKLIEAIQAKAKKENAVDLNDSQALALLNAVMDEYNAKKKQRDDALTSQSSTE